MKSKNSLCNKAIIKNDFHRFGPIIVISTIVILLLSAFPFMLSMVHLSADDYPVEFLAEHIRMISRPVIPILAGIGVSMLLFNYMNNERESYTLHALPVKRKTLFFSHYVFGLCMIYIPVVIAYLAFFGLNAFYKCGAPLGVLNSFIFSMIEYFFFYNLGCMVMMLCGNSIIACIVDFVLIGIPAVLAIITEALHVYTPYDSVFCFNIYTIIRVLDPCYFFQKFKIFSINYSGGIIYEDTFHGKSLAFVALSIIPACLFMYLSIMLYNKRQLESVGEFMAFRFSNITFRVVFTFFASCISGILFSELVLTALINQATDHTSLYWALVAIVIVFSPICYLIANMILQKSFHVFKTTTWKAYGCVVILLAAYLYSSQLMYFSYRLPNTETVSIAVTETTYTDEVMDYTTHTVYKLPTKKLNALIKTLEAQQIHNSRNPRSTDETFTSFCNFSMDNDANKTTHYGLLFWGSVDDFIQTYQYGNETTELYAFLDKFAVERLELDENYEVIEPDDSDSKEVLKEATAVNDKK